VTRDGILFIEFDDEGRVNAKTWFQFPPDSTTLPGRVRSWLSF
jgi:hypothetical protein